MTEDLLTVEEVAAMMDMHSRTIRRYIKEGILNAAKFGGQWRIKKEDLKKTMSRKDFLTDSKNIWERNIEDFIAGGKSNLNGKIQTCTISDVYCESVEEANEISNLIVNLMNSVDSTKKNCKMQYMFDDNSLKARFIFWGNPEFVQKLISVLAKFEKQ
ncbi:MAG: helix-turn-helix domain-containing protein [Candidatus Cloacimonetes bacterium]|nr:helix-turn-helix domain-containing protein [Candidatus Cloacimonadota bacterium]